VGVPADGRAAVPMSNLEMICGSLMLGSGAGLTVESLIAKRNRRRRRARHIAELEHDKRHDPPPGWLAHHDDPQVRPFDPWFFR